MGRYTIMRLCLSGLAAGLLVGAVGCAEDGGGATPPPGGPGPAVGGPPAAGGSGGALEGIMKTLAKGPNSLTPTIGKELQADKPAWETIQGETKEYARLAGLLGAETPPKGSAESWAKLTASFAGAAESLNKAAIAKDKAAALAAHQVIADSCKECHQEHRSKGRGGRGGPGMGGPPPGVPPAAGK